MDIEKILIYIVLAVIYYGFKFLKKKGEKPQEQRQVQPKREIFSETFRPDPNLPGSGSSKTTITDILEEMKKREKGKYEEYNEKAYSETRSLEQSSYENESERIVIENVNPYTAFRTVTAEDTEAETDGRFAAFATHVKKEHPVRKLFTNKLKIREAIIASEILKRRV